ncbi:outer membrane lipoprotein chaperone LolA [Allopusillimonas soli]|uniref:Outer-membrane lipoprotein carrier protein n=1 Tax=Allopusillimonas soli TaxID=659016 RepID=A0A853FKN1_9BURK|nr:outer membrane lipoprotein chaperone LolA [Allopusillimonas soli]NYT38931.1 outer membrane lipoprotein chaperone LolA [Allopusillimonas soli]TEA70075.1 outer membrane lipoprotein chaperone LolA [Allopusillimonas soli]
MKIKHLLAVAALALAPLATHAASAEAQLRKFIADVPSASGQFTQQRLSDKGQPSQGAESGTFSFKRPGQFNWHVVKPYEQLVVSDGKKVYQYDPDLAQVTVRPVGQSIGASPAAILFGEGSLDDNFTIAALPASDGIDWMRATPKGADAGFVHVDIGFLHGLPARLLLLDAFGQTTRIDLTDITLNPALGPDTFTFDPPAGVDVVKMQ